MDPMMLVYADSNAENGMVPTFSSLITDLTIIQQSRKPMYFLVFPPPITALKTLKWSATVVGFISIDMTLLFYFRI